MRMAMKWDHRWAVAHDMCMNKLMMTVTMTVTVAVPVLHVTL